MRSIASLKLFLIAWLWGYCTFYDSSVVSLKSAPWAKYTQHGTFFQKKKIMFYYQTFFFFKYVLYSTVLNNYLKKKKTGAPCLFPHKLPLRVGVVLRSQSGWRICVAVTGTRYKIKTIAFEVRTRDQAFFSCFYVWYRQHRNSYLGRVQQIPWNEEKNQDLMRSWSYESLFVLFCIAGVLCSSELGFVIFALAQQCLTKKL